MQQLFAEYGADAIYTEAAFCQAIVRSTVFESEHYVLLVRSGIRTLMLCKELLPKTVLQLVGNQVEELLNAVKIMRPYVS